MMRSFSLLQKVAGPVALLAALLLTDPLRADVVNQAANQPAAPAIEAASPSDPPPAEASPSDLPPPAAAPTPPPIAPACPKTCAAFRVRPQDQLWAVSTRHLGCGGATVQAPNWRLWRYANRQWLPASAAEFYDSDSPEVVTTLFIHGNRIDHGQAFQDGQSVYFQMAGKFDEERPVRFVIWSWPSSQIKGQLKDVRAKAWRTDVEGYYLARFLAPIQPDTQVGLIGYSYGARIITGSLHLLGGGSLAGRAVPAGERPQLRAALWAPAMHNHWLVPGHYHGQALTTVDHCLLTYNCCDPVLSRYRWLEKCGDPVALGYSGLYGRNLLPADVSRRVEQMDVTCIVGGTHAMQPYLYSPSVQNRTRQIVLWHELESSAKPAAGVALATAAAK